MNGTRIGFFAFVIVAWFALPVHHAIAQDAQVQDTQAQDTDAAAAGDTAMVVRSGQYITVTSDVLTANEADELIAAFGAAAKQWAEFWKLPQGALDQWHTKACVIKDKQRFVAAGLIPQQVPDFKFGYALDNRIWVMHQESTYYTRHLLLHEGVHSLAFGHFGGAGPSWFMEGTAELLSVHTGSGAQTKINQIPPNREAVPFWGRFKLMSANRKDSEVPSLETVMSYPADLQADVKSYGWSWAAAMLFSAYPDYRGAFDAAAKDGQESDAVFNAKLKQRLAANWPVVQARWRLMCHDLDYGFDWSRETVQLSMADQLWDGDPINLTVKADRGWQSIGVRLKPGMTLHITPSGQCIVATDPKPWVSEPAGVTLHYDRGRPRGQLLACLVPNSPGNGENLKPLAIAPITRAMKIPIKQHCWMLFRINDAPDGLADNTGGYSLKIKP